MTPPPVAELAAALPGDAQKMSPDWDLAMLVQMPKMALAMDSSGSPTGSGPPGHTRSTCPGCVNTAAGNEDRHRSRSGETDDDRVLLAE